ncbi:MAG: polymer-forming cytoskeletal protein [Caldilineaceae bacterium]|nr:polymer-forming cytoskeletal protein [Caldilineaceae bacterium]
MKQIKQNTRWLLAAALITLATLGILFAPAAQAAESADSAAWSLSLTGLNPEQRVFNEDLLVADGQVINDNVAVLNGDVTIRAGGIINGNLSVVRGDVDVAGQIRGDLAVVQGDAKLRASAQIGGDVSIVGGEVERAEGARVGGNFVGGPSGEWQKWFKGNEGADVENAPQFRARGEQRPWLVAFFWRMVQALLWTLLVTGLVLLIVWLAPAQVKQVAATAEAEPALSFAVGAVVTLVITFLSMGLFATICLAPAGFLLTGMLAIAGLVGWAATAQWIGTRLAALGGDGATARIPNLAFVGVTALVLTGLISFSWALLACIGFVVALLLISPGLGGVLVNLARRTRHNASPPSATGRGVTVGDSDTDMSPQSPGEDVTDIVTGDDLELTDEERAALQRGAGSSVTEQNGDDDARPFVSGDDLGLSDGERRALQAGITAPSDTPADFTQLKGIGPAFDLRLKEAGITTFAALAGLTAEEVSAIIGWPPERVVRDELLEQAAALAGG